MPRELLLMRHAKSSWRGGLSDHERPLNPRGERDAPRMARALAIRGWWPDLVLCSDATRTRETWAWMAVEGEREGLTAPPVTYDASLYLPGWQELVRRAARAPAVGRLLVLSHNPGTEEAIGHLGGEPVRVTTATVARLLPRRETDWAALVEEPAGFVLQAVLRPKELDDAGR